SHRTRLKRRCSAHPGPGALRSVVCTQPTRGLDRSSTSVPLRTSGASAAEPVMLARIFSACLTGVEAALVPVEADVSQSLPAFATGGPPELPARPRREPLPA